MVAGTSIEHLDVDVRACTHRKTMEEVVHELRLEIADPRGTDLQVDHRMGTPAEIDCRHRQRLVHRHHEISGPVDATPIAKRLRDRLAEGDAEIFDGVML